MRLKPQHATRRSMMMGLVATALSPSPFSNARPLLNGAAISGHQFKRGDQSLMLADIISPVDYDLHSGARLFASEARAALGDQLSQRDWRFFETGQSTRWGHQLVRTENGELERLLIQNGSARVAPMTKDHAAIADLLAAEQIARSNSAGLWSRRFYRVRNANEVDDCRDTIGAWQVLAGRVISMSQRRQRTYLNFGDDYQSDVTVTIPGAMARQWLRAGFDLQTLDQQFIRVRGYFEWINGPSVEVHHPFEIECLGADGEQMVRHPLLSGVI